MKKYLFISLSLISFTIFAQIPSGYYDGTDGLTGAELKTKLSEIITNGHIDNGYDGLWTAYATTDIDNYYENDGTILDMYSEIPSGDDPYEYEVGVKQCGNTGAEGTCYNREHIVPQSLFNKLEPMVNDVHFIRPTDGKVNGMRANYPFGEISNPSQTSLNGSLVGANTTSGFSGTVFEPIDEFKGDIARMVFYFITRYQDDLPNFSTSNGMLSGAKFPGLQDWELQILLAWAAQDPVSTAEIDRNNASYDYQGNRNPYIDHPEWVTSVWGTATIDTTAPTAPTNLTVNSTTTVTANLSWTASTDDTAVTGYQVYVDNVLYSTVTGTSITVSGLSPSTAYNFYVIAKDANNNLSDASSTVQGTTLSVSTGTSDGLYISEYIEGSSLNKAIEVSNNTGSTIDLSQYSLKKQANGAGDWTNEIKLSGTLETGKAYVVANTGYALTCNSLIPNQTSNILDFNGNDPIGLFLNGVLVDIVGTFNGGSGNFAADTTLLRNVATSSTTFDIAQWDQLAKDNCENIGIANPEITAGTQEVNKNTFSIYPNPVKNFEIFVKGDQYSNISEAVIFNSNGQIVQKIEKPFKNSNKLSLKKLPKGVYLLKLDNQVQKFIIE